MSNNNTQKISLTLSESTIKWLENRYPDALGEQEAIRMAINDARTLTENAETIELSTSVEGNKPEVG